MPTRLLAAAAVAAISLGGGAALAATHGGGHPAQKRPARTPPASNVHYPCRHHGAGASGASAEL